MRLRLLILMLVLSVCAPVVAAEEPEPVRLTASPAPEPVPALRYSLLPQPSEIEHGNGAAAYLRAAALAAQASDDAADALNAALYASPGELKLEPARKALSPFNDVVHYAHIAARRQPVDWDLPLEEGFSMLMPELSHMRAAARALALKARIQIAEGRFKDAIGTLATGMALGRDLGEAPTLIHGLVGIAIGQIVLSTAEDLVRQPGSPNLYWALAMLPDPAVSLRRGLETEIQGLAVWPPALANPLEAGLSPEGWNKVVGEALARPLGAQRSQVQGVPVAAAIALVTYTDAKEYLIEERGLPPERVESMPVLQVVATYIVDGFRRVAEEGLKWYYVDYPAYRPQAEEVERNLRTASRRKDTWLSAMLLPAFRRAREQEVRLQRRVKVLQAVEALRMHAAANDGELPASLGDVQVVPIPEDPVTGQPFSYELTEEGAVLSAPPVRESRPDTAMRYELTIQPEETR